MMQSFRSKALSPRGIAWLGGIFICAILAMSVHDIVRGYHDAVTNTGHELDIQARTIAEQTARSFQAVDVQLRHIAQQFHQGNLSMARPQQLRTYLEEQAIGLVQIEGLLVIGTNGEIRASSYIAPAIEAKVNVADKPLTQELRADRNAGLVISSLERSQFDQRWMFPIGRRLEQRVNMQASSPHAAASSILKTFIAISSRIPVP